MKPFTELRGLATYRHRNTPPLKRQWRRTQFSSVRDFWSGL